MTTITKADLVVAVAERAGLTRSVATQAVEALFGAIEDGLRDSQEVRVGGFGSFLIAERKATKGRNPRTGEVIDVPASTSVRFKPAKGLKDAVGSGE